MRLLLIKTSSLGDIIHTFPAVTDALKAHPQLQIDWVVEESFKEVPRWHPAVHRVIPVAFRRWKKAPLKAFLSGEWQEFKQRIQQHAYDYIIDAQGLLKSAILSKLAQGPRYGLDRKSAREPLASIFYRHPLTVARNRHAVERLREMFAQVFCYDYHPTEVDYGLSLQKLERPILFNAEEPYLVFLHGTTWATKHWPEDYWQELAKQATASGYRVYLPWGDEIEKARAERIAACSMRCQVLSKLNLSNLAFILAQARGVVAVDTGLGHLAAALNVPTLSLYGPTDPRLTGTYGHKQKHLSMDFECAPCLNRICHYSGSKVSNPPCFSTKEPAAVWENLAQLLDVNY